MPYEGSPPAEQGYAPPLSPGWHRVKAKKSVTLASGDYLLVLENDQGEAADFIGPDCTPRPDDDRDNSWVFWRLAGAFDYPSPDYWETAPADRDPMSWDVEAVLDEIVHSGKDVLIKTEDRWTTSGDRKARIKQMFSTRRGKAPIDLEPGESKLIDVDPLPAGSSGPAEGETPF